MNLIFSVNKNNYLKTLFKKELIIIVLLFTSFSMTICSKASPITEVFINGEFIDFTSKTGYPIIDKNNRTLIPFRLAMESYGAEVNWNKEKELAIAKKDNITIEVPINKNYIYKNEHKIEIDTNAIIKEGRTYLPIRAVFEAFGATVLWDGDMNEIKVEDGLYKYLMDKYSKICINNVDIPLNYYVKEYSSITSINIELPESVTREFRNKYLIIFEDVMKNLATDLISKYPTRDFECLFTYTYPGVRDGSEEVGWICSWISKNGIFYWDRE